MVRAFDVSTLQEVERGETKCARYWPDQDVTEEYGGFAVLNIIEKTGKERLYYPILLCDGPCSDKLISNFLFVKAEWM